MTNEPRSTRRGFRPVLFGAGRERPSEGPTVRQAPLLEHLPGTRVANPSPRGGWSLRHVALDWPKIRFRHRPAKGDGFRRIEVPSTALEPTRLGLDPPGLVSAPGGLLPRARSGPIPCHAAPHVSVICGALLQRVAPLCPPRSAPRPDEPSTATRLDWVGRVGGQGSLTHGPT